MSSHSRKIGAWVLLIFGVSLLLGGDCQSLDDVGKRSDCSDELSDGTFTGIKIILIDLLKIPEGAVFPLGIILVFIGVFLIFWKQIKEKLSPVKKEQNKPDEEA